MLKTKKFRRLLAGLLAVLMLSVCLPVGAFATGNDGWKDAKYTITQQCDGQPIEGAANGVVVNGSINDYAQPVSLEESELASYFTVDGYKYAGKYLFDGKEYGAGKITYTPGEHTLVIDFTKIETETPVDESNPICSITYYKGDEIFSSEPRYEYNADEGFYTAAIVTSAAYQSLIEEGYSFEKYTVQQPAGVATYYGDEWRPTPSDKAWNVSVYFTKEEPAPEYISYKVVDAENPDVILTTWQVLEGDKMANYTGSVPQKEGYTFDYVTFYNNEKPVDLENTVAQKNSTGAEWVLYAHFTKNEEPAPEYISYKVVDAENPDVVLTTWQVLEGDKMANYTGSVPQKEGYTFDYVTFYNNDRPVDLENTVAQKNSTGAEWVLYAHFTKNEDAKEYITYIIVDAETKEELATWQVLEGDPLASYTGTVPHKDGYTLDYLTFYNNDKPVDLKNTVAVKNGTGTEWTLEAHFKEVPADYEDVQVRFEFVDAEGNVLHTATNYATSLSDEIVGAALKDIVADEIAEVEAEGYKQVAFTLVFEDGYETTPLNEPHVVPEYNGKTIKVYFAKVENYEDVNVRFEFVDMDGNTIQPATNYATSLSDSIVGPKVSEVLADEIDKLAADGYDFDHYAWVLADGTETVLTDPVVVPDYDDTTIKVYFVKVEEYEDVHVRFEFVDMDGNSVLPATNYATCLSDSVVGPKVNDVLADELSTMEGRNYNFHHYAWVYSDGTETELDNDVIVVPDHDGTTIKVYFEAVKTEPSDPSTGDNTTTVTGKDEHPDIAEAKANGTWGAPTATPAAASTIPQTGDSMPVVMLIVIALVAAGAVGGLVVLRKRSHQ